MVCKVQNYRTFLFTKKKELYHKFKKLMLPSEIVNPNIKHYVWGLETQVKPQEQRAQVL